MQTQKIIEGEVSKTGFVIYESSEAIATITLNRPEAANAQTLDMLDDLDEAWRRAREGFDEPVFHAGKQAQMFARDAHGEPIKGPDGKFIAVPAVIRRYSDGVLTPSDAFNFARYSAPTPLDFLAVSEHNHLGAGMHLAAPIAQAFHTRGARCFEQRDLGGRVCDRRRADVGRLRRRERPGAKRSIGVGQLFERSCRLERPCRRTDSLASRLGHPVRGAPMT